MTEYFIPSARPVHLVKNFDDVPVKKRKYPMVAQEKHDGCYCFAVIARHDYRTFSRTGKSRFLSLAHLEQELYNMHSEHDFQAPCMLIFEVKADLPDGTPMSAAKIAGRCQDETMMFPEAYAVVHDCIPFEDFKAGHCKVPYETRYDVAKSIAQKLNWKHSGFAYIADETTARAYADKIIAGGGEGAVFKQPDGTWTAGKKNEVMMKIKQELSYDLEVLDVLEGEGKYKGTLGTLVLHWRLFGKPDGETTNVYVSGMTDAQRNEWWADPRKIVGSIVQVDAMRFTEFGMLREPRFKGIRYDKEQADIV